MMNEWIELYGQSVRTAVGFFWKSGWAFVLGYFISGMIQAFVPKKRLTKYMGKANLKSVSLATVFGAASSSCSFAALAAARALVKKGAHFIVAVMFVSIVATALILQGLFALLGIVPESSHKVGDITQFKIDYTFWMNLLFAGVTGGMLWLNWQHMRMHVSKEHKKEMKMEGSGPVKRTVVYCFIAVLALGAVAWGYTAWTG